MAARHPRAMVDWHELSRQANLTVQGIVEPRGAVAAWSRLHRLWLRHAVQLRQTLGADLTDRLLAQASLPAEVFAGHRELVLVLAKR